MFATTGQAWIFLATVYGGLAVGLLYDLLSALRHGFRMGPFATGFMDFLFWLCAALILALTIGLSGGDGLRAYMLLGFACGFLLYAAGIHALLEALGRLVARFTAPARNAIAKRRAAKLESKKTLDENPKQAGIRKVV
ncbi:MAG TPA: spore cortex biosynthesis protein YabQ [Clostridia bacterium]|nr:spore cortex biosynthesis protein YabQ [Clostridia bacterium]